MGRVYNYSPGPAMMPLPVLERAQKELVAYGDAGMSVMEMSHRSAMYIAIYERTERLLRELMSIPDSYEVLFLQGGATEQFSAVPLNLMVSGKADYIDSGNFAYLAAAEAARYLNVTTVASSRESTYTYVPDWQGKLNADADYLHITTNNTIYGTRFTELPEGDAPLVADMSSNILSETYDVNKFGVIYAGAQKNIGPAGLVVVIVRKDLLGHASDICPKLMNWTLQAAEQSMINTPNTYGIYMAGLCFEWLQDMGGVAAMEKINIDKAQLVYDFLDESKLFKGLAQETFRSRMNITFATGDAALDDAFIEGAEKAGMVNLRGHRTAGGMRASIYNAMPVEGVEALVAFMKEFEVRGGKV